MIIVGCPECGKWFPEPARVEAEADENGFIACEHCGKPVNLNTAHRGVASDAARFKAGVGTLPGQSY